MARWWRAWSGPARRAVLASVSASRTVGASAVAATMPVQAGSPVEGSRRWWRGRAVVGEPGPGVDGRGRDGAGGERQAGRDGRVERVGDVDLLRSVAADAQVAAAVDRPALGTLELGRGEVGDVALARAAEVEPQPHRAVDDPGLADDADLPPALVRMRAGGPAGALGERDDPAGRPPVERREAV